jgi:hypothetical protein
MHFEIVGPIEHVETIARGTGIRELKRLVRTHGQAKWRKRKGIATVKFKDGPICEAELHWYEATGVGRRELKVKRLL